MHEIHLILVLLAGMVVVANFYEVKLDRRRRKESEQKEFKKHQSNRLSAQKTKATRTTSGLANSVVERNSHLYESKSAEKSNHAKPRPYYVSGKCWVIDADDISVNGQQIRLSGIDAPESGQIAVRWNGVAYNQGEVVKRMLCKKIGGKTVKVRIEGEDKYGRKIGTVFLNGRDINRMMVREGWAISAYGNQYKEDQSAAKKMRQGIWKDKVSYDPRYWKHGERVPITGKG